VQQEVGSPPHADQHSSDTERCEACAIARSGTDGRVSSWLAGATVTVDTDVVVISGPHIAGRVIVPRQHIGGLEELPLPRRAQVLAAIRRAAAMVGPATVVVSTDSPASASHVCFHVLPSDDTAPRDRLP
jgi:diadenosine tetraphosphate (Ap4A) HIT family hydrolase